MNWWKSVAIYTVQASCEKQWSCVFLAFTLIPQNIFISHRFFARQLDTFKAGLIRLYVKPYPSEAQVLENLNATFKWEDFKDSTLKSSVGQLRHRKLARRYKESRLWLHFYLCGFVRRINLWFSLLFRFPFKRNCKKLKD